MTHDKNNTRIEIIVKRKLALRRIQICFLQKKREREREQENNMHNARPNSQGNQMHRGLCRAGKISGPWTREDQRIQD